MQYENAENKINNKMNDYQSIYNNKYHSSASKTIKYVVIILVCILLFSCSQYKKIHSPYVALYRMEGGGELPPQYLALKLKPKVFETYLPVIQLCVIGLWNVSNDTLYLFPKYEYYEKNDGIKIVEIISDSLSVVTIPQRYLIKNGCLIDKSDYSILSTEYFSFSNSIDNNDISYKRVKIKEKVEKYHLR